MAEREVIVLNESTPQLEAAQSGDTYLLPRDVRMAGNIIIPSTSGIGMKINDTTPDWGWNDLIGVVETKGGGTEPTWATIDSGPFYAYKFSVNDECWIVYHVKHDYAPGTDIYFHVHWMPDGTDANSVKWQYTYSIAKGHQQSQFDTTGTTITSEQSPEGTAYEHQISETAAVSSTELEVDCLIRLHLKRITNGGTNNTDDIFVDTADIHYQSTNIATKNKAPNFYT